MGLYIGLKKRASNGFIFDEINVSTRSDFFNLEIRRGRDELQQYSLLSPFIFIIISLVGESHGSAAAAQRNV